MAHEDTPEDSAEELAVDVESPTSEGADLHEENEEEHGSSLAAKALSVLALLVVGGGVALWGGPKIAPNLPAGMAPVAEWLAPGGAQSAVDLAALKSDIESRFDTLPAPLAREDVEGMIATVLGGATADLNARMDALGDQVSASDSANIESRLATLETKLDGLQAELGTLVQQLTDVTLAGGEVSADTLAQIASYSATLSGLKAEIARLAAQNGALSQKIDEIAASAERQVAAADSKVNVAEQTVEAERRAASLRSALEVLKAALATGAPFEPALASLQAEGVAVPEGLSGAAKGVVTLAQLRADFPAAANAAIRTAIAADSGGNVFSAFGTFLKSQVATRSLSPQEGGSVDAVLSRAEAALKGDDLVAALGELNDLPPGARAPMADWIAAAEGRLKAETAFAALSGALQSE